MLGRIASTASRHAAQRPAATVLGARCMSTGPIGCWMVSMSINLPHPDKKKAGGQGEDAVFHSTFSLGVADGVGGWAESGIDAGGYSRSLVAHCANALGAGEAGPERPPYDLAQVADGAWRATQAMGSSTLCLASVGPGMTLRTFNLGDSGWLHLRLGGGNLFSEGWAKHHKAVWGVVDRSTAQTHYFNCPLQLGTGSADEPSMADQKELEVRPGDIVVLGTDGLLDNLFEGDVASALGRVDFEPCLDAITMAKAGKLTPSGVSATSPEAARTVSRQCSAAISTMTAALAVRAQEVGSTTTGRTPFEAEAHRNGYEYSGGKLDDVGLAIGLVMPLPRPPAAAAAPASASASASGAGQDRA